MNAEQITAGLRRRPVHITPCGRVSIYDWQRLYDLELISRIGCRHEHDRTCEVVWTPLGLEVRAILMKERDNAEK